MTTRREFLAGAAAMGATMTLPASAATGTGHRLFIGTANTARDGSGIGPGIFAAEFVNGSLTEPELVAKIDSPGFLATAKGSDLLFAQATVPHGNTLAASYRMGERHALTPISRAASDGAGGCHIGVSHDSRAVFVANYGGGSVSSFLVDNTGKLSQASFVQFPPDEHGPDKDRQDKAHAHCTVVSPDGDFVFVNDLGLDRIHIFRLDHATAKLQPHSPDHWKAAPGSGPRHVLLHPNGRWVYNINEMASSIDQLLWNATHGVLTTKATMSTLPPGSTAGAQSRACEMVFGAGQRFLYASNRIHESFAVFSVNPATGALTFLQERMNPGKESRHMAVDPSGRWLLSANQFSGDIAVFPIDGKTGHLGERSFVTPIAGVSCLLFA